jgi:hypothetical protein
MKYNSIMRKNLPIIVFWLCVIALPGGSLLLAKPMMKKYQAWKQDRYP